MSKNIKHNSILKRGTVVQSVYRAHWHGVILGINYLSIYKNKTYACYEVLAMETVDGRKHRKPALHILSEHWIKLSDRNLAIPDNYKYIHHLH